MKRFESIFGVVVVVLVVLSVTGVVGDALRLVGMNADNVGMADAIVGLATLFVAGLFWLDERRRERRGSERIRFLLKGSKEEKEAPLHLLRRDVARAEVLGRLGMMPMAEAGKRFSLSALSSAAFLENLNEVTEGKTSTVMLEVTQAELDQFDWSKIS